MKHYLKTLTEYFNAVENGTKTFEVRYNDRGFKVGDTLILQEWDGWERTGREISKIITYMLDDPGYCKEGYAILGIEEKVTPDSRAYCEDCNYSTETMTLDALMIKLCMDGGYIMSDKQGGYFSQCPKCSSGNLTLDINR